MTSEIVAVFMFAGSFELCFISVFSLLKSEARKDQKCLQNSAGKPSGPGAF